ncbi:hypothetical protein V6N13_089585 [Hibiscus sabdariffa]
MNFPEILCRDNSKILRPNVAYLQRSGFGDRQIAAMVDVMRRKINEVATYPDFFRQHGLKKRMKLWHRLLKEKGASCSLSEMLD